MEAITAPSSDDERMYMHTCRKYGVDHSLFPVMTKDSTHTCLKIWRRLQPLPSDDEGMYTHLSENMEVITAPTPCPMTTKDCARPPSNFRSHTRSNCCSTEHAERLLVVQCMFLFKDFTQTARPDTEYRIYSSHYGNVQCHLAHE